MKTLTIWASAIAVTFLAAPAYALTINDPGVVGAASGETGSGGAVSVATTIGQHLLDMAANTTDATGCDIDGTVACYETSSTEYAGAPTNVLAGGTEVGGSNNVSGYTWVVAKYDGPEGGYVLFHIPTLGGTTIPWASNTVWGRAGTDQYGLSHYVGFNGTNGTTPVPDGGATLMLLGAALGGLGVARRRMKA